MLFSSSVYVGNFLQIADLEEPLELPISNDLVMVLGSLSQVQIYMQFIIFFLFTDLSKILFFILSGVLNLVFHDMVLCINYHRDHPQE